MYREDLSDERVMKAILLVNLGVPETDDIIRRDSWIYSAVRIIRGFEDDRQQEELRQQAANAKGR